MAKQATYTKEINGTKYVFQFNGVSEALRALDNCYMEDGSGNLSNEKLADYLFENVVVEPSGLTPDDFDSVADYQAVAKVARDVMQGNFPKETDKKSTKTKG